MQHIKLNEMGHRAHASTYYILTHILNPWGGVKGQKKSEITHVAYHIKTMEHREPCNHIFCSTPWKRSKGKNIFFLNEVMMHAKLKGMEHSSYSVLTYTHPQPAGRVIKGKTI